MTKIKEVARAIAEHYGQSPSFNWQKYEGAARAAIEALREPTNPMLIAAMGAALAWMKRNGVTGLSPYADYPSPTETTRVCYTAMIDAILSEGE